jgi:hypothetical protein
MNRERHGAGFRAALAVHHAAFPWLDTPPWSRCRSRLLPVPRALVRRGLRLLRQIYGRAATAPVWLALLLLWQVSWCRGLTVYFSAAARWPGTWNGGRLAG